MAYNLAGIPHASLSFKLSTDTTEVARSGKDIAKTDIDARWMPDIVQKIVEYLSLFLKVRGPVMQVSTLAFSTV